MEELEGSVEEVEQVGSTAVPMAARSVPDMLVILIDPGMMWACLDRLGALGHERSGEEPFVMIEHSKPPCQLAILHREHPGRREMLLFRDPLRSDPRLRCRYEALRLDLPQRCPFDRSVQRMVKREFMRSAIRGVEGAERAAFQPLVADRRSKHRWVFRSASSFRLLMTSGSEAVGR